MVDIDSRSIPIAIIPLWKLFPLLSGLNNASIPSTSVRLAMFALITLVIAKSPLFSSARVITITSNGIDEAIPIKAVPMLLSVLLAILEIFLSRNTAQVIVMRRPMIEIIIRLLVL